MKWLKDIFDFYINSSIHVSLAVVALCWITSISLDINVNYILLAFVFFSTVTGYNFVKYAEVAGLHHKSLARSLRSIQLFSLLCGVAMVVCAFWMSLEVWVACGLLGLVTLLYAVPFFLPEKDRDQKKGNLRSIAGLKIYIIGGVWTGVTVILPVLDYRLPLYEDVWVVSAQRFLYVIAVMVPFEIRDVQYDAKRLRTLPQIVGIKKAKIIAIIWLFIYVLLEFLRDDISVSSMCLHLAMVAATIFVITLSRKRTTNSNHYFTTFWVEGIPLLWLWLALLLSYLNLT